MNALSMVRDWRREVQIDLLPRLHGHQSKAMAELSFAMTLDQHCQCGKLAVAAPGKARAASAERRLERYLANARIAPDAVWPQLARSFLAGWAGGPIVVILDETPNHNDLRCLKVNLAFRKRALPLGCACYSLGEQPEPVPELVVGLLRRVAACLPEGAEVTLLADRGLAWPQVVGTCHDAAIPRIVSPADAELLHHRDQVGDVLPDPRPKPPGELVPGPHLEKVSVRQPIRGRGGPPEDPPPTGVGMA